MKDSGVMERALVVLLALADNHYDFDHRSGCDARRYYGSGKPCDCGFKAYDELKDEVSRRAEEGSK